MKLNAFIDRGKSAWLWRLAWSAGAVATLSHVGAGLAASTLTSGYPGYRSATAAPEAWQAYARELQSRVEARLAGNDEDARQFQDFLANQAPAGAAPALTMQTWISPYGKIERIVVDGLDDLELEVRLRALLSRSDVGVPPPDMLQPLRLRLSLRPEDQPRQEK
jgi:hypothetical protein